jgi:hypothetical protein
LGVAPASAGVVTENYSFSLGGFTDINGSPPLPPPVTTVTGSFTVTFDPTLNYDSDTADVTVHSLSGITVDSPLGFTYDAASGDFFLGGTANDSDFVSVGTNDFVLTYNLTDLSDPQFIPCSTPGFLCGAQTGNGAYETSGYTTVGNDSLWFIATADSSTGTTPVPEPFTLSLFGAGLAGGAAMRRRKRVQKA